VKRREFVKTVGAVSATGLLAGCDPSSETPSTSTASPGTGNATANPQEASTEAKATPDWVKNLRDSDMPGLGPDGKPDLDYDANGTGHARVDVDPLKQHEMTLTQEEQDILDGKQGDAKAKVMKTVVMFGNAFGATHLVDLGGAPHSSVFNAPPFMKSIIDIFNTCADEGLKSYAPFTVNPRPFDLYNVETQPVTMNMVFEGYPLQPQLDHVLNRIGARGMVSRSCACYTSEVGNAPEPGTNVAWAESSAVNFGNSVLGVRTNRYAGGMELLCALVGKAPYFGLMTDEGRMATWLIDVKTTKEPDWGVLGAAIGIKVVEDVPYIAGIDQYFGGEVTKQNMHLLKAMGSSTAANGAVGLYHVEGVTPDAKEKGRDLLVKDYQTYVIDDAELDTMYKNFPNLWAKKNGKPTIAFVGCPHNTYHEVVHWGELVVKELKKRGQDKVKVPMILFTSVPVRDHVLDDHPVLVRDMKRAGMHFTNMCALMYTGLKGFSEMENAVTNSNKTRKYSPARYFPEEPFLEIVMTGEIPADA
jgi:predicted aconitase